MRPSAPILILMKKINVALDENEYDFVKTQLKGYVRSLVRQAMSGEAPKPHKAPIPKPSTTKPVKDAKAAVERVMKTSSRQIETDSCPKCGFTTNYLGCTNRDCNWKKK